MIPISGRKKSQRLTGKSYFFRKPYLHLEFLQSEVSERRDLVEPGDGQSEPAEKVQKLSGAPQLLFKSWPDIFIPGGGG